MKRRIEEEPIEQVFAELVAQLVEAEEVLLPSLEAKARDIRDRVQQAYRLLTRLEHRVTRYQVRTA